MITAAERGADLVISGTTTGIEDGQVATVNFNGNNYTGTVTGGVFSVTVPAAAVALLADTTTYVATASVSDAAGNAATPDTEDVHTTDTTAGTITLDEISNDVITAAERGADLVISGTTTGIEDGQVATVANFNGNNYTGTVTGGVFSVTVPAAAVALLADTTTYVATASVSDAAGNAATPDTEDVYTTDTTAGTITLDEISNDVITAAERGADLVISGTTTGIEDGQVATVNFNGNNYTGTVTGGVFSVTVPAAAVALLADTTTYVATASVSDAAGNAATPDTEESTPPIPPPAPSRSTRSAMT